eukprot:scaffold7039_cov118-Isochrysis_galbana.AAC.7
MVRRSLTRIRWRTEARVSSGEMSSRNGSPKLCVMFMRASRKKWRTWMSLSSGPAVSSSGANSSARIVQYWSLIESISSCSGKILYILWLNISIIRKRRPSPLLPPDTTIPLEALTSAAGSTGTVWASTANASATVDSLSRSRLTTLPSSVEDVCHDTLRGFFDSSSGSGMSSCS